MKLLENIRNGIDYKKNSVEERMGIVNEILTKNDQDLVAYFDEQLNVNLNGQDRLLTEDSVCRTLENLANYILNSDEVKAAKTEEDFKYVFHTDQQYFNKKINRENSIEGMSADSNEETVIHFLISNKKNYKKSKTQIITRKDLERQDYAGHVLRQYDEILKEISQKLKRDSKNNGQRYLLTRASGQIKSDMLLIKDQLLGTFGYNSNPSEGTDYNLELVDMTNPNHVEALLRTYCDFEPTNELSYLVMAFEQIADETKLTVKERKAYNLIRKGEKNIEIANELSITPQRVGAIISTISKKIAKQAVEIGE